jgi:hypothetical protein
LVFIGLRWLEVYERVEGAFEVNGGFKTLECLNQRETSVLQKITFFEEKQIFEVFSNE